MVRAERGRRGERRAAAYLEARGYEIVERNFRSKVGELDLIAREGGDLVFIEVRARAGRLRGGPVETVNARKRARLARVAEAYIALRAPSFESCRFDVVGVTGTELELIRDAFRLGE